MLILKIFSDSIIIYFMNVLKKTLDKALLVIFSGKVQTSEIANGFWGFQKN